MSDQHQTPAPDEWWRTTPPASSDRDDLAAAAEAMRDAAEYMRDAATPPPPPKESHWDWSWLTNWLKYTPTGRAFKAAVFSSGPAFGLLLWVYHNQTGSHGGAAAAFFAMLVGLAHLFYRRAFTRWLLWGAVLGPLYYPPALLNIVLGIAHLVAGGK